MDHMKVLRRSFEITWRYRVLWVFGILLALTSGGGGGNGGGGSSSAREIFPRRLEIRGRALHLRASACRRSRRRWSAR